MTAPVLTRAPCPATDKLRVGVLVSGGGTNLQALLDASAQPDCRFTVATVVSNVAGVRALDRAATAGIASRVVPHGGLSRADFEEQLHAALRAAQVELVVLAGFMRVLSPVLVTRWPHAIVNVHPALCPAFPGMHAARQALAYGARITGCTVHLVDVGVDTGPVLAQAAVPIHPDDDEAVLQARIQREEHRLLPTVVDAYARGDVLSGNGRVFLRAGAAAT